MTKLLENLYSNVLVTKMKVINSRRLTPQDYDELLKKKYVSDIVAYLKETHFNAVLQGVDASSIKCDELEGLFKAARLMEYKKLLKYVNNFSDSFFKLFWLDFELEQLLTMLLLFKVGRSEDFGIIHSAELVQNMKLDVGIIVNAKSTTDILRGIKNRKYVSILKAELENVEPENINILLCEKKLKAYFYEQMYEHLKKCNKALKNKLEKKMVQQVDIYNLQVIYRLKKYYDYSAEEIMELIIPYGNLAGSERKRLALCRQIAEDYNVLFEDKQDVFNLDSNIFMETGMDKSLLNDARETMKMERYAQAVFWSFMDLAELEQRNLVSVIYGIENKQDPEAIKKMLVC